MIVVIVFCAVVVAGIVGGVYAARAKTRTMKTSRPGSIRVETVKAHSANSTIAMYAQAGWACTNQTSTRSLGRQAQVTLTFQKK